MAFSPTTEALLKDLDAAAGKLSARADLGLLIEWAFRSGRRDVLADAACLSGEILGIDLAMANPDLVDSKIVKRSQKDIDRLKGLMDEALRDAPAGERDAFRKRYGAATATGFVALLPLCYDLAWFHRVVCMEGGGDA